MYVYYRGLKYISTNVTVARAALLFTHICPKASRDNHFGTLEIKKAFKFQYVFVTVI